MIALRITGQQISWEDVRASLASAPPPKDDGGSVESTTATAAEDEKDKQEPRTLSFAEITALIESNQTHLIPNNEEIPGGVNVSPRAPPVILGWK